jgi:hypothetical protein
MEFGGLLTTAKGLQDFGLMNQGMLSSDNL